MQNIHGYSGLHERRSPTLLVLAVYLDPEQSGPAQVHVTYFDRDGKELPIADAIDMRAGVDDRRLVQLQVRRFGLGHFVDDITLERGTIHLQIVAALPGGDSLRAALVIQI